MTSTVRGPGGGEAKDLAAFRAALVSGQGGRKLAAGPLRRALTDLVDWWLIDAAHHIGVTEDSGFAVCAFGGLGRAELMPYSDLDLVLVYDGPDEERVQEVAEALWYPLWDAGFALDHSVRTVGQCLTTASSDITVATGLLEVRPIAGDVELGELVRDGVRRQWRQRISTQLDELFESVALRRERAGLIADLMEPDLKNGAGGTRDAQLLDVLALAHVTNREPVHPGGDTDAAVAKSRRLILDARTELQRASGRPRDVLVAAYGDEVAGALGYQDRFELVRALSAASRTVAFAADTAMRTARAAAPKRGVRTLLRREVTRIPLAEGVVAHNGEVVLAKGVRPSRDPGLILRVAAASATNDFPIAASTLRRLAEECPEPAAPWSRDVLRDFLLLLGSGAPTIGVIEALDQAGLWGRLIPEWAAVRNLPARDAAHIYTVDRHLVQVVVEAASRTAEVDRPDLLLVSALIHDLGKGRGADHSVVGAELALTLCRRFGFDADDTATVSTIVRHHLLLAVLLSNRDPEDPATAEHVLTELDGDVDAYDVLTQLTVADSLGTGPSVWTSWKSRVLATLDATVRREISSRGLGGPGDVAAAIPEPVVDADALPHVRLAQDSDTHEVRLEVVARAAPSALHSLATVTTAHGLDVSNADIDLRGGETVRARLVARTKFGSPPESGLIRQDLRRTTGQGLTSAVTRAFKRRVTASVSSRSAPVAGGQVRRGRHEESDSETIVVRSTDRPGLLADLIGEFDRAGITPEWVTVRTRGNAVDDTFALRGTDEVTPDGLEALVTALRDLVTVPEDDDEDE